MSLKESYSSESKSNFTLHTCLVVRCNNVDSSTCQDLGIVHAVCLVY